MADRALSDGRVALVTGAAGPIGGAVCAALARAGWTVAAADDPAPAGLAARAPGPAAADPGVPGPAPANAAAHPDAANAPAGAILPLALDPADADATRAAVAAIAAEHGTIGLLVTTADGGDAGAQVAFDAIDPASWNAALRRQLHATVHSARAVLPGMLEARRGQIVPVVSASALDGGVGHAHRASAEGAVIGLVKALAREFGPQGIDVNVLAPGDVAPAQVAETVAFLAGESHFFAGQVLSPSAGRIL